MKAFYEGSCPGCGGTISVERSIHGYPCEKCLATLPSTPDEIENLAKGLEPGFLAVLSARRKSHQFSRYIKIMTSHEPTPVQNWVAHMIFLGEGVAISMPDGLGKTTTGVSLFGVELENDNTCIYLTQSERDAEMVENMMRRLPRKYELEHAIEAFASGNCRACLTSLEGLRPIEPDGARLSVGLLVLDDIAREDLKEVAQFIDLKSSRVLILWSTHRRSNRASKSIVNVERLLDSKIEGISTYQLFKVDRSKLSAEDMSGFLSQLGRRKVVVVSGENLPQGFRPPPGILVFPSTQGQGSANRKSATSLDSPDPVKGADILVFFGMPTRQLSLDLNSPTNDMVALFRDAFKWIPKSERNAVGVLLKGRSGANSVKRIVSGFPSLEEGNREWRSGIFHFLLNEDELSLDWIDLERYLEWLALSVKIGDEGVKWPVVIIVDSADRLEGLASLLKEIHDVRQKDASLEEIDQFIKAIGPSSQLNPHIEINLLVVESPTKARTIAQIFHRISATGGKEKPQTFWTQAGSRLLQIVATKGHVYDLVLDSGFHGVSIQGKSSIPIYGFIKRCSKCGNQVISRERCNRCGSCQLVSKEGVMRQIRRLAASADSVLIATDPDTEGEKIAMDIWSYVSPYANEIGRVDFHEITRRAVLESLSVPRTVSLPSVQAQIVRRVEDRWIGFELSKRLWENFSNRHLSAGRAQTPVLGWIVDRARENKEKKVCLIVELESGISIWLDVTGRTDIEDLRKNLKYATAKLEIISEEVRELNPLPPYSTDAMLRDAYSFLRFGPSWTMKIAQDLFEMGLITYHRTDSTRLSSYGIEIAKTYLEKAFPGEFKARSWGAGGAHEAIRPTRSLDLSLLLDQVRSGELKLSKQITSQHRRLYEMIFRRFIASQMRSTSVVYQRVKIELRDFLVEREQRVEIKEPGFTKVIPMKVEKRIEPGEQSIRSVSKRTLPKVRLFSVGDLIATMREKDIGRPSTYAKLVETIFRRKYAFEINGKVIATKLGIEVSDYLRSRYDKYISEETTRALEQSMRRIEEGEKDYQSTLNELYQEVISLPPAK